MPAMWLFGPGPTGPDNRERKQPQHHTYTKAGQKHRIGILLNPKHEKKRKKTGNFLQRHATLLPSIVAVSRSIFNLSVSQSRVVGRSVALELRPIFFFYHFSPSDSSTMQNRHTLGLANREITRIHTHSQRHETSNVSITSTTIYQRPGGPGPKTTQSVHIRGVLEVSYLHAS